jgi:hypothetical protein
MAAVEQIHQTRGAAARWRGLMRALSVVAGLLFALATPALARSSHPGSGRSTGEFRTFSCKSSSCFAKHPSGTWTHTLTAKKR